MLFKKWKIQVHFKDLHSTNGRQNLSSKRRQGTKSYLTAPWLGTTEYQHMNYMRLYAELWIKLLDFYKISHRVLLSGLSDNFGPL